MGEGGHWGADDRAGPRRQGGHDDLNAHEKVDEEDHDIMCTT